MNKLQEIYKNLQKGKIYGRIFDNCKYPFFDVALHITESRGSEYIAWQHYGSSANDNTIEALKWIIEVIFECSAEQFAEKYSCTTWAEVNAALGY